jgi:hypothetical protein
MNFVTSVMTFLLLCIISNSRGAYASLRLSTTDVKYKAKDHRMPDLEDVI